MLFCFSFFRGCLLTYRILANTDDPKSFHEISVIDGKKPFLTLFYLLLLLFSNGNVFVFKLRFFFLFIVSKS